MKKSNMILMAATLLVIVMSMTAFAASGQKMQNTIGHDFGEEYFALDVDFNSDPTDYGTLPSTTTLIKDYIDPTNDKIVSDLTTDKDRQFFLSYTNTSGIETAYLALEKIEQPIVVSYGGLEYTLGHANGTAPFQALVQHYESYLHDIFVTNFFNAFIAYETTSIDPWLDSGDDMYLGYSMVESHLLDLISAGINTAGWDAIDPYGWEAFYNEPATSGSATTTSWGIEYSNMMVFWQNLTASFPTTGLPAGAAVNGVEGLITGGDLVAAALFDTMKFTYEMTETTTTIPDPSPDYNWSVTESEIATTYDLGAISLLITRDDPAKLTELQGLDIGINTSNSFSIPSQPLTLGSITILGTTYTVVVTLPDFCFYKDTAARMRIDAAAMEGYATGMGLAVVSSTNLFSVDYEVTFPNPATGQEMSFPIIVGGEDVFDTSFVGKSTYTLDKTIDGGYSETLPIRVDTMDLSNTIVQGIFTEYFEYESEMMIHFLVFMAKQTSPLITAALGDTYGPNDIEMNVDQSGYMTFVQMPKWSGYPIVQDPTFSAVAAVKSGGESETTGETEETTQTSTPGILDQIPGFEFLAIVAAVPLIILISKKRK